MQQRQDNSLNRSAVPVRRPQVQPGPVSPASRAQVASLDERVTLLETALSDHETRIAALEAALATIETTLSDHEARIAALEP